MFNDARNAWLHAFALALSLGAVPAVAQAPPAPPDPAKPGVSKPSDKPADKPDESDMLRIRGLVESADESGVRVQMSKGVSIRVDIAPGTPVYVAERIGLADLAMGAEVGVRSLSPPAAGENSVAADVLAFAAPVPAELSGLTIRGLYKSIDRSGEKPLLVVSERGADRRLTITNETAFWRLQPADLKQVKAGGLISVVLVRNPSGGARTQRAVFGMTPAGGTLPL